MNNLMVLSRKRTLFSLLLVVFIDLFGFGLLLPYLPYIATHFHASGTYLGLLFTSYSFCQFLMNPVWGSFSDKWGRKPTLVFSMMGNLAGLLLCAQAHSFAMLLAGRIVSGLSAANLSIAYSSITDLSSEEERPQWMGFLGAVFGLGFTLGPAMGAVLYPFGFQMPFYVAASLCFLNACLVVMWLSETRPAAGARENAGAREKLPLHLMPSILSHPYTGLAITVFFVFTLATTQVESMLTLYLFDEFSFSPREAGYLMGALGMVGIVIQGTAIRPISKRFSQRQVVFAGLLVSIVGYFFLSVPHTLIVLFLFLTLVSLGRGFLHPALTTLASMGASVQHRGFVMGVFQGSSSLARTVGPLIAGLVYDHWDHRAPFRVALVFMIAATFAALLYSQSAQKNNRKRIISEPRLQP